MASHISQSGFVEDGDGFIWVRCECGEGLGPAPDEETMLDIAMEHAYQAAMTEWREASDA